MNLTRTEADLFLISDSCNVLIIESRDKLRWRESGDRAGRGWRLAHITPVLISHYTLRITPGTATVNISLTRPSILSNSGQPGAQLAASQLLVQSKKIAADCAGTHTSAAVAASEPHHVRS